MVKSEYENFSVGRKVGWLGVGVVVDPHTVRCIFLLLLFSLFYL